MARPTKQGLEYFSFDTDFFSDVKIRRISRACGPASTSILICLLCNIYRDKGYYISWDENLPFVVADTVGTTEGAVEEVVKKAIQVGFFDKELFDKYQILTSNGIQNRFKSAVTRRQEIEYVVDYLVSERKNEVIAYKNEVIDDRSTQSKVKVKRKNNISPSPPLKGGCRIKKSDPKKINSKARFLFEEHFKSVFSDTYYWTAKDAGAMSQLLKKLTFSREQKNLPVDDDSVLYALEYFLSQIKEGWIFENFSVTNINSKFNEIVSQAKKSHSAKPDVGIVLRDNSVDKYSNDDEKWKR
ncbi:MAG: DUF4373 domain-containing protein [Lachnospira sp.]|jgi:hypothetical protein|nr:DUF4373 domain-containing protein [Lachnospira sp.]